MLTIIPALPKAMRKICEKNIKVMSSKDWNNHIVIKPDSACPPNPIISDEAMSEMTMAEITLMIERIMNFCDLLA